MGVITEYIWVLFAVLYGAAIGFILVGGFLFILYAIEAFLY